MTSKIYLYGKLSTAGTLGVVQNNLPVSGQSIDGKDPKCYISFSAGSPAVIEFSYAISFVSPEQARKNYMEELTATSFSQLRNKGQAAWEKVTGQIQVEGGTEGTETFVLLSLVQVL